MTEQLISNGKPKPEHAENRFEVAVVSTVIDDISKVGLLTDG